MVELWAEHEFLFSPPISYFSSVAQSLSFCSILCTREFVPFCVSFSPFFHLLLSLYLASLSSSGCLSLNLQEAPPCRPRQPRILLHCSSRMSAFCPAGESIGLQERLSPTRGITEIRRRITSTSEDNHRIKVDTVLRT